MSTRADGPLAQDPSTPSPRRLQTPTIERAQAFHSWPVPNSEVGAPAAWPVVRVEGGGRFGVLMSEDCERWAVWRTLTIDVPEGADLLATAEEALGLPEAHGVRTIFWGLAAASDPASGYWTALLPGLEPHELREIVMLPTRRWLMSAIHASVESQCLGRHAAPTWFGQAPTKRSVETRPFADIVMINCQLANGRVVVLKACTSWPNDCPPEVRGESSPGEPPRYWTGSPLSWAERRRRPALWAHSLMDGSECANTQPEASPLVPLPPPQDPRARRLASQETVIEGRPVERMGFWKRLRKAVTRC